MKISNFIIYFITGGLFTVLIVALEGSGHKALSRLATLIPVFTLIGYQDKRWPSGKPTYQIRPYRHAYSLVALYAFRCVFCTSARSIQSYSDWAFHFLHIGVVVYPSVQPLRIFQIGEFAK